MSIISKLLAIPIGKFSIWDRDNDIEVKVTPQGELKTETNLMLSAFGDLNVAELSPIFQGTFEYTVDNTDLNTNTTVAGGTVTQANAMAVVGSSATTVSLAMLQSKQHARYRAGFGGVNRFTTIFSTPVAATDQLFGLADELGSNAAAGSVDLTGGAAGSVDGITVDGVEIMSGAEAFDTDLTETARNVVTNINANTSVPNYSASHLGTLITITSDVRGTGPNTFVVTSSVTTITTTDINLSGGTDGEAFKNGYMIGYIGTVFGFHRFSNNTITTVAIADWDDPLDGSGESKMIIDQTKLNVFYIQFPYLGGGSPKIWIENQLTGKLFKVHTELYANLNTEPSVHNPNFHHTMYVNNKATTSDIVIKGSSYAYMVEGKTDLIEIHQPEFGTGIKEKTTVTSEVAIFTIRNKSQYASKTNFIDSFLIGINASIEADAANNLGAVRLIKNADLGGDPSYSDINTANSVLEIDVAGTTVTGGEELAAAPLAGKNDKEIRIVTDLKFLLNPTDTLTLAGSSDNSATIRGGLLMKDLF